jgi:ABC-type transport system involved in multi-copper enzyme maturation permease subunit
VSGVVIVETLRRHLTNAVFIIFTIVLAIAAGFNGATGTGMHGWAAFIPLVAIILGCQLIGPEFSSGTLQLILAKPINRTAYLLSRFVGVMLAVWIVIGVPFAVDSVCRVIWGESSSWRENLALILNVMLFAALTCALLALYGTFLRSYFNAGLYLVLQIAIELAISAVNAIINSSNARMAAIREFLRGHPIVGASLRAIDRNLYPGYPEGLNRAWLVMVISNTIIALFIAALIFRAREVPYGADSEMVLRAGHRHAGRAHRLALLPATVAQRRDLDGEVDCDRPGAVACAWREQTDPLRLLRRVVPAVSHDGRRGVRRRHARPEDQSLADRCARDRPAAGRGEKSAGR